MKDIITKNFGIDPIAIEGPAFELRPTEFYLKEDGAKDNKPSLCIVLSSELSAHKIYGQISVKMLNRALNELGYELKTL